MRERKRLNQYNLHQRLIKLNTRQRCAKIGLSKVSADMEISASLRTEISNLCQKNLKILNINQKFANSSQPMVSALTAKDVYSSMRIDYSNKYMIIST